MKLTNTGKEPLEVLWHKTSLVDLDSTAHPVAHGGRGIAAARDISGPDITLVPGNSTMKEFVIPRESLQLGEEGWAVASIVPVECGPVRCSGGEDLVGRSVRLSMTLRREGKEETYDWIIRITQTSTSIRGDRPKE